MRLFFDVSVLPDVTDAVTGISRVLLSAINGLLLEYADQYEIYGISFRNEDVLENPDGRIWNLHEVLDRSIIETISLPEIPTCLFKKPKKLSAGDCIICMGEQWLFPKSLPILRKHKYENGVMIVTLIHDLVPFFMPELYWDGFCDSYALCIKELVDASDLLLVYSDSTKIDLIKYVPDAANKKISKIKLGDSFGVKAPKKPDHFDYDRFVLCVGTIQPRKNHMLLLYAWRSLQERYGGSVPALVIVGSKGWGCDDFLYFIENNPILNQSITIIESADDNELEWMYKNSWLTVYPSIYEGWGLPIAESLAAGKLCLCSNKSSMPEVGLDLVKYFSPYDPMGLVNLLEFYLENPEKLEHEEDNIRNNFVAKSWTVCAETISAAIQSCFTEKSRLL